MHKGLGITQFRLARARQVDVEDLLDPPRALGHHRHPVRQENRLIQAVGNKHDGFFVRIPNAQQLTLQGLAGLRVEGGERFVHQQHIRVVGQRAGNRYALAHAAGQLVRVARGEAIEAHQLQVFAGSFQPPGLGHPADLQAHGNVVEHRAPGQQCIALEHNTLVTVDALQGPAIDQKVAAGLVRKPCKDIHKGRLAAARRPEDGQELALAYLQVKPLQHGHPLLSPRFIQGPVLHAQVTGDDLVFRHQACPRANGLKSLV